MAELKQQAGQPARAMGSREAGPGRRARSAPPARRSRAQVRPAGRDDQGEAGRRPDGRRSRLSKALRARRRAEEARQATRRSRSQASHRRRRSTATANGRRLLRQEVGPEEIAEVVSAWTGIPVTRMMETERAKLLVLEERLHQRVVGQDEAVDGRGQRRPPQPQRPARSEPADRLVHLPAARPASAKPSSARRWPKCCSTTRTPWSARHERVHGEAHRQPADRRAAGLRRLRRRRQADRSRPPPAVLASCCSTKSKRPIATCSTSCCKCSTTAA